MNQAAARFGIRFGRLRWLLTLAGTGPRRSSALVGADELRVRMGWAFSAVIPRSAITTVRRDVDMKWGVGVHGWNGRWLVNGSTRGIATVEIEPPARARVYGFPVNLRRLHLSLDEPDRFVEALAPT